MRLTIYSKPGCHLCDDMKSLVRRVVAQHADRTISIDEVDIGCTGGRWLPLRRLIAAHPTHRKRSASRACGPMKLAVRSRTDRDRRVRPHADPCGAIRW